MLRTTIISPNAGAGGGGAGLKSAGVLAQSATPASVTGTTTETTLATIPIPAGAMGANGSLRITTLWSYTNSANTKTPRVTLGGTAFFAPALSTTLTAQALTIIRNRNAMNSQVGWASGAGTLGIGSSGNANVTAAVDMSAAQNLLITGQLASAGETLTLEGYTVELLNP